MGLTCFIFRFLRRPQVGFDLIGDTTEVVRELRKQRRGLVLPSRKLKVFAKSVCWAWRPIAVLGQITGWPP